MSICDYQNWVTYQKKEPIRKMTWIVVKKIHLPCPQSGRLSSQLCWGTLLVDVLTVISSQASPITRLKLAATCKTLYKNMNLHLSSIGACLSPVDFTHCIATYLVTDFPIHQDMDFKICFMNFGDWISHSVPIQSVSNNFQNPYGFHCYDLGSVLCEKVGIRIGTSICPQVIDLCTDSEQISGNKQHCVVGHLPFQPIHCSQILKWEGRCRYVTKTYTVIVCTGPLIFRK